MRANTGIRKTALFAFCQIAFICTTLFLIASTIIACSGYGDDYANNLLSNDFFSSSSDRYQSSSSVKTFFNSSSSVKYSSSSKKRSFFDESSSSISDSDNIVPIVNTFEGLDSCQDGKRLALRNDSTIYRCFYGTWYKEIKKLPECNNKTEKKTFFKSLPYICVSGEWREITEMDVELGFCTEKLQGTTKTFGKKEYTCDSLSWRKTTLIDINGECSSSNIGKKITYDNTDYVCRDNLWQSLNSIELDSGLCTPSRSGEIIKIKASSYFKYYICKNYEWTYTESPADIYGKCTSAKEDSAYTVYTTSFACRNGEWRNFTAIENKYGLCTKTMQDSLVTVSSTNHVICDKNEWRSALPEEFYGACKSKQQDVVYQNDTNVYTCNSTSWIKISTPPYNLAYCLHKNEGDTYRATSTKTYLICNDYEWKKTDSLTYEFGICNKENLGTRKHPNTDSLGYECRSTSSGYGWTKLTINDYDFTCNEANQDVMFKGYLCDNGELRTLTSLEKSLGICTKNSLDKKAAKSSTYYRCTSTGWTSISKDEYNLKDCTSETDSSVAKISSGVYFCTNKKWTKLPDMDKATCTPGALAVKDSILYQCVKNQSYYNNYWHSISSVVYEHGFCNESRYSDLVLYKNNYYACKDPDWQKASIGEIFERSSCSETRTIEDLTYTCSGGVWSPKYETMKDPRDGQTYRILTHNKQTMMVDNLNYKTPNSWCYQNTDRFCNTYGRLYPWEDVKTACPEGWHVRAADEELISRSIIEYYDYNYWQQDVFTQHLYKGLEIKGSGLRYDNGSFEYELRFAGFWTATELETDPNYALVHLFYQYTSTNVRNDCSSDGNPIKGTCFSKQAGLSIRCVKD